ncbi:protein maelstrom homolog [Petromyzon marinus]|uniref:protein maelstrom homolog n=1 Tax=Petromyzon marinus TaxID=7757 RepID=UPI003F6FCE71
MPPKRNKNGFFAYMKEQTALLRQAGIEVMGLEDAARLCAPGWEALDDEGKRRYRPSKREESCWQLPVMLQAGTVARGSNDRRRQQAAEKEEEEAERIARKEEARRAVVESWPPGDGVCDVELVVVDVLMKLEEPGCDLVLPCELAAARFSLRRGLIASIHHFVDSGPIPLGFRYQCELTSKTSHQLPTEGFALASSDYSFMLSSVMSLACGASVVYARHADTRRVASGLDWLARQAGVTWPGVVLDAERLLVDLYLHAGLDAPSFTSALDSLGAGTWDYDQRARCAFHWDHDVRVCSLRSARCLCFCLCDCLCPALGVTVTEAHVPSLGPPAEYGAGAGGGVTWQRREAVSAVRAASSTVELSPVEGTRGLHRPRPATLADRHHPSWDSSFPPLGRAEPPGEAGGWARGPPTAAAAAAAVDRRQRRQRWQPGRSALRSDPPGRGASLARPAGEEEEEEEEEEEGEGGPAAAADRRAGRSLLSIGRGSVIR